MSYPKPNCIASTAATTIVGAEAAETAKEFFEIQQQVNNQHIAPQVTQQQRQQKPASLLPVDYRALKNPVKYVKRRHTSKQLPVAVTITRPELFVTTTTTSATTDSNTMNNNSNINNDISNNNSNSSTTIDTWAVGTTGVNRAVDKNVKKQSSASTHVSPPQPPKPMMKLKLGLPVVSTTMSPSTFVMKSVHQVPVQSSSSTPQPLPVQLPSQLPQKQLQAQQQALNQQQSPALSQPVSPPQPPTTITTTTTTATSSSTSSIIIANTNTLDTSPITSSPQQQQPTTNLPHNYLKVCSLSELPSDTFTLFEPLDVLDALVSRLPYDYLSKDRAARTIPYKLIVNIILAAREIIASEPMLLQISAPVNICGDIHGQMQDLLNMFAYEPPLQGRYFKEFAVIHSNSRSTSNSDNNSARNKCPRIERSEDHNSNSIENGASPVDIEDENKKRTYRKYLFLGDYVDRGLNSIEVIIMLLALKIISPNDIYLLRGNHESAAVSARYGFFLECKQRYPSHADLYKVFVNLFMYLPVAAVVDGAIFCSHGGISPDLVDVTPLARSEMRPFEVPSSGVLCDLLWSDPVTDPSQLGWRSNERGVSYCFGEDVLDMFLARNGFQLVCRGHQVMEAGYGFFPPPDTLIKEQSSERKLVTVFSASNYGGEFGNCGAMMVVDESLRCRFHVFQPPMPEMQRFLYQGANNEVITQIRMRSLTPHLENKKEEEEDTVAASDGEISK